MRSDIPFSITAYVGYEGYAAEVRRFLADITLSPELCALLLPHLAEAVAIQEKKFLEMVEANDAGTAQAYNTEIAALIKLQTELILFLARK